VGVQGGRPADLAAAFAAGPASALVSASRSVIYAYREAGGDWQAAAGAEAERLAREVWSASGREGAAPERPVGLALRSAGAPRARGDDRSATHPFRSRRRLGLGDGDDAERPGDATVAGPDAASRRDQAGSDDDAFRTVLHRRGRRHLRRDLREDRRSDRPARAAE